MGGGEYITNVTVSNQGKEQYRVVNHFKFSNGDFGNLRLGLKKETIINSFPSLKWDGQTAEKWYERKLPMTTEDKRIKGIKKEAFYDEEIVITFYFYKNVLSKFCISKVTSLNEL